MKLLLVEDEIDLSWSLKQVLEKSGYTVDVAHDGYEGFNYVEYTHYDAIISDIMMPKMDGITMVKRIRGQKISTPILLLSAKTEVDDKILGLDAGADDYMVKPFAIKELLAHIRAITRRSNDLVDVLHIGNVTLDPNNYEIKTNKMARLTNKEYKLMECFIMNKNTYLTTEKILSYVWDSDTDADINVVWVFISSLRKKLESIKANIAIKSSRGVGYKIEEK